MSEMNNKGALVRLAASAIMLTGCSRAQMNYQIAESIGTIGKYSNNEPVESPQMKAERLDSEAASEAEADLQRQIDHAQTLAASYDYEEAIKYLMTLDTDSDQAQEKVDQKISELQSLQDSLTPYTGSIPHLCFPLLIQDGKMAFDGDEYSATYRDLYVTTSEFSAILQSLYDNNYVLVSMHDVAGLNSQDASLTEMTQKTLELPPDKKPLILSQDNVDYSSVKNGNGIASKLVMDDEGKVKAQYTDDGGHNKTGDYDLIPILDSFVDEHPDFSYMGARGTISVSGSEGVFGLDPDSEGTDISQIADALKREGWEFACAGYTHSYMNGMDVTALSGEMSSWEQKIQPLVGKTDIIFYPYGAEVAYPSDQLNYMISKGIVYHCGLWSSDDYLEVNETYLRQTRRFIDGYSLVNAPDYFTQFFRADAVLDQYR